MTAADEAAREAAWGRWSQGVFAADEHRAAFNNGWGSAAGKCGADYLDAVSWHPRDAYLFARRAARAYARRATTEGGEGT